MQETTTAKELRTKLQSVPPDTEITFGTSRFLKLPLVFYRIKIWGENSYIIELNELMRDEPHTHEPEQRITAEYLLEQLDGISDNSEISFGSDTEANLLQYGGCKQVLNIIIDQDVENREPYRLVD